MSEGAQIALVIVGAYAVGFFGFAIGFGVGRYTNIKPWEDWK